MRWRPAAALLLPLMGLGGCAQVLVLPDGSRQVTGLVRVVLPPATAAPGADTLRLQTLGVALVLHSDVGNALVLGYGDTSITAVRNHALVPAAALRAVQAPARTNQEAP